MSMFAVCVLPHHLFPNHEVSSVLGTSLLVTKYVTILNLKGLVNIPKYVMTKWVKSRLYKEDAFESSFGHKLTNGSINDPLI